MEEKKKYRTLLVLILILILICVVQGFYLLQDSDFKLSWRKEKNNNFDRFSQSLLDEYKQDKKNYWDRFDQFFDDDFFRGRNNPFQEMEKMQRRMREMMENGFQNSFNDSWDEWFNNRFNKESNDLTIQTQEEKDNYVITINIPNFKENNLNIAVDASGVHIEAEVEQVVEKKDSDENIISSSKVRRRLDQTFPVPHDAAYEKAKMKYKKDKVIITLPKL